MWNRGTRSSALERAQAQLSGRRVGQTIPEPRDIKGTTGSMDAIVKRKTRQHVSDPSSEGTVNDDVIRPTAAARSLGGGNQSPSLAGGVGVAGGGSRFLKKAPPPAATSSKSQTQHYEPRYVGLSQQSSILQERMQSCQQARERHASSAPGRASPPSPQSSSNLSMKGKRFLKNKTSTATSADSPAVAPKDPETSSKAATPLGGSKAPPVTLDSDEEDMRKLLGGSFDSPEDSLLRDVSGAAHTTTRKSFKKGRQKVSSSPPAGGRSSSVRALSASPPRRDCPVRSSQSISVHGAAAALRPPSPRATPLRPPVSSGSDHSDVCSLKELLPVALDEDDDDAISERSGGSNDFKINIMSLDDLAPITLGERPAPITLGERPAPITLGAPERPAEKKNESRVGRQRERAPGPGSQQEVLDYQSDFESDNQAETAQSASEISERLGDEEMEVSEINDRSSSNSDRSLKREDVYSSSLSEKSSLSRSRASRTADWLSSRTHSRSSSSRSPPRPDSSSSYTVAQTRPRRPALRDAAVQTQPDGLVFSWTTGAAALGPAVGMTYVDPTPVASHSISAEAVEVLSAYSPAVFALNDMLRQQLSLTRHFVQASRHMHASALLSLGPADHAYTTLEDTKEFIRRHKTPKRAVEIRGHQQRTPSSLHTSSH